MILLPEFLRVTEGYYLILYALAVIVLMVFCPTGMLGLAARLRDRLLPSSIERGELKQGAEL